MHLQLHLQYNCQTLLSHPRNVVSDKKEKLEFLHNNLVYISILKGKFENYPSDSIDNFD